MSAQDRAAELLADLEGKADDSIAALRAKAADVKSRLEAGMLNLQSAGTNSVASHSDPAVDLNWDLEAEAAAPEPQAQEAIEPEPPPLDDIRFTAPEPASSFKDELDVATDELGIPLGD